MEWKQNDYSVWISVYLLFIVTTVMIRIVIILYLLFTFVILILPWQFLNHCHWYWTLWFLIFLIQKKKNPSIYTHTTHLHIYPHSSSLPSGHLQGGHNPSEWWECWAGTYQRCRYDQQHPHPTHTHTHRSVSIYVSSNGGLQMHRGCVGVCVLYACCYDQFLLERWKADFLSHLVCRPVVYCLRTFVRPQSHAAFVQNLYVPYVLCLVNILVFVW